MACIKKLEQNITYDCERAAKPASICGVDELVLVNYDDISNYSVGATGLATITMKTGTKGYVVNSVNNSVSATISAKVNDIIATAQEHSVVVKLLDNSGAMGASELSNLINALQIGTFVALARTISGDYLVYGLMSGLECSEIVGDSATDGIVSVTLKTPDAAGGDRLVPITMSNYSGIKAPKV